MERSLFPSGVVRQERARIPGNDHDCGEPGNDLDCPRVGRSVTRLIRSAS